MVSRTIPATICVDTFDRPPCAFRSRPPTPNSLPSTRLMTLSPSKNRHDAQQRAPSPRLLRTKSKGKEKEKERERPQPAPTTSREVGSATIQLRQDLVERLVSEGDDELDLPGPSRRKSSIDTETPRVRKVSTPTLPRHKVPPPPTAKPPRRPRANSVHLPSETAGVDRSFYLSHFSTDRQYSLKPGEEEEQRLNLELGLGDDFDVSFGEALRRGVGGEEMPLPREALRVLSEAKDNLDIRMMGKQGRKGSIGMGLFKESRAAAAEKRRVREEVIEEEEGGKGRVKAATPRTVLSSPPRVARSLRGLPAPSRRTGVEEEMESETSAGITLVSAPQTRSQDLRQAAVDEVDADSGWTTTTTGSFTSASEEEEEGEQRNDSSDGLGEMEEEAEDEERMTVPLQPFNHAVGGHSSIYNFTRRVVCKVSLQSHLLIRESHTGLAPCVQGEPVLRGSRAPRTGPTRVHTPLPGRHARELPSADASRNGGHDHAQQRDSLAPSVPAACLAQIRRRTEPRGDRGARGGAGL